MLINQFEGVNDVDFVDPIDLRPRMRTYHLRVKQKRSQLDDYDLKQTIGQGGFGKVKKAIHKLTGELVAVKICSVQQYDQQNLATIEREIELQKNLMHENIAQIYEVIKKDSKFYIFMEYCKNGELFDKINRSGPLPEKQAAKIFNQILSALIYLKQNGLSHRDIKPQNVLFDENWNVKLIDFGFSCSAHLGQFRRTVCGTPSYTPPQIIKKISYDPQLADVWCLGVTTYAMLAAQLPFQGETNDKRKANIVSLKYIPQPNFSMRAQKLINSIFVDAKQRPRLWELKNSEFSLNCISSPAHFINFKNQDLIIQQEIIEVIDKNYHVDPQKVLESVKTCRFDKYHALYYLTLKNQKHTHRHVINDHLDEFRKRRKGSLIKLQPITRTPSISKKANSQQKRLNSLRTTKYFTDNDIKIRKKKTIDPNECRLRKSSPDSPRRLLDCLAAYKEN